MINDRTAGIVTDSELKDLFVLLTEIKNREDIETKLRVRAYHLETDEIKEAVLMRALNSPQRAQYQKVVQALLESVNDFLVAKEVAYEALPEAHVLITDTLQTYIENPFPKSGFNWRYGGLEPAFHTHYIVVPSPIGKKMVCNISTAIEYKSKWDELSLDQEILVETFQEDVVSETEVLCKFIFKVPREYLENKILTPGVWAVCFDKYNHNDKRAYFYSMPYFVDGRLAKIESEYTRIYQPVDISEYT